MPRGVYKRKKSKVNAKTKAKAKVKVNVAAEPYAVKEMTLRDIEEADLRQQVKEWYDAAPSTAERQKRKAALLGVMYGGGKAFKPEEFLNMPKPGEWINDFDPAKDFLKTESGEGYTPPNPLPNPKTLTGQSKVPVLSVIPPASIIAQATAMRYGAFFAPKVDGSRGYGPYNWRDQPIEGHIYIDAAIRHLMQWWDGEDSEVIHDDEGKVIDVVSHLAFALATIGILIDASENRTVIDDRPRNRQMAASSLLNFHKLSSKK